MIFSKLMLGTVQFGLNYGIANTSGKPSYETVKEILKTAYESGVNCIDTSPGYGDSEEVIGRVMADLGISDQIKVVSKIEDISPSVSSDREAEKLIIASVESSLKRLKVGHLSVCLLHIEEDIKYFPMLKKLEDKGLIGGSGISLDSNKYCNQVLEMLQLVLG